MMIFNVITLFPEFFESFKNVGVVGRSLNERAAINLWNLRDYTTYKQKKVDERPYGGGPGMVLMAQPIINALEAIEHENSTLVGASCTVYLSPTGRQLTQPLITTLQTYQKITLICGRYEGVDQRVIDHFVDYEISIGDYVLSGGELPGMVLMDAVIRQIDGVLGNKESFQQDSFAQANKLDHPHYTYPREILGHEVPEVLLSGHHENIQKWREKQAEEITQKNRPDLIVNVKNSQQKT